jgi:hypothetical protein
VVVNNNVVVNNFIDVTYVERHTKKKVRTVEVVQSNEPGAEKLQGDRVNVFTGNVEKAAGKKPAKLKNVNEISQVQAKRKDRIAKDSGMPEIVGPQGTEQQVGDPNAPAAKKAKVQQGTGTGIEPQQVKKRKNRQLETQQSGQDGQPKAKKKRKTQQVDIQQSDEGGQQKPKKKRKAQQTPQPDQDVQPQLKKKRKKQPVEIQQSEEGGQKANKKKRRNQAGTQTANPNAQKRKKQPACDPEADPNCAVQ